MYEFSFYRSNNINFTEVIKFKSIQFTIINVQIYMKKSGNFVSLSRFLKVSYDLEHTIENQVGTNLTESNFSFMPLFSFKNYLNAKNANNLKLNKHPLQSFVQRQLSLWLFTYCHFFRTSILIQFPRKKNSKQKPNKN